MRRFLTLVLFSGLLAGISAPCAWANSLGPEKTPEEVLSLADTLVKAGDRKKALEMLEEFLKDRPGHTDGEILYARTLGWNSEYERSAGVYREVLRREPQNAEALSGLARVLSWKGDYGGSIDAYKRSLFIEPRATETRMGLARTLWWKGDVEGSLEELSKVISREPSNQEALGLERRLRQDKGPYVKAGYANSVDSDENRLEVFHGAYHDAFGTQDHRFEFTYKAFDASLPGRSAKASVFEARDSIRVREMATLTPRLAVVSVDSAMGATTYLTEGIGLSIPVAKGTHFSAGYSRYPLVDTVTLIENNIKVREAHLGILHDVKSATLSASLAYADYSDGNTRYDLAGGAAVNVMDAPRVIAGAASEYRAFSEKAISGYFNPPHIFSNSVYLEASGGIWHGLGYRAKATLGVQSFEDDSDLTTSFQWLLDWTASRDLWFEAGYKYSRSALESASGFRFEEFRAAANYLF